MENLILFLILFVGLRLFGIISWSWWWVLAPLWIPFILIVLIALFIAIIR